MDAFAELAKRFELRKMKAACNAPGCEVAPSLELQIIETDLNKARSRQLASLFLCSEHAPLAEQMAVRLNGEAPAGTTIALKQFAFGVLPKA